MPRPRILTYDELLESLNNAQRNPNDTAWNIYRYLNANYKEAGSEISRTLLATFMKLPIERPSLLYSCMLSVACKMSVEFPDFRFDAFLRLWGYPQNFRTEDKQPQVGKDGRKYLALTEKVERQLQSYFLHHPEALPQGGAGRGLLSMIATKVFETEHNGRKLKSVKLVGPKGEELLSDSHLFPCKPWEITGRLFDILTRVSKEGNSRAHEIVVSQKNIADVFPTCVGYVEHIDLDHNHIHVYDQFSRHLVADVKSCQLKPQQGQFVKIVPVIPLHDRFKSAIILSILDGEEGAEAFGYRNAKITYIDPNGQYAAWELLPGEQPIVEEGTQGPSCDKGYINSSLLTSHSSLTVGSTIKIITFLKRGKDAQKRPAVVQIVKL